MSALVVYCHNTHVGESLEADKAFVKAMDDPADIVLLQECNRARARARARRLFPPHTWSAVGPFPVSWGRGSSGTLVFARKSRLRKMWGSNDLLSSYFDRMHPERRSTWGSFRDRESKRQLLIGCAHTWTMGATTDATRDRVVRTHRFQVDAYGKRAGTAATTDIVIVGGDWNEHLTGEGKVQVEKVLRAAGLKMARDDDDDSKRLDEVFVSRGTEVVGYQRHDIGPERQHPAITVRLQLRPEVDVP